MAKLKKKSKITNIGNGGIWLPEVVIQHILSFMSGKEAAQTSILSKSWHTAWSTRPNLNFSRRDFSQTYRWFLGSAKKTVQRYEQSNLRIDSFTLSMDRGERDDNCMTKADKLINRALKLGATELSLTMRYYDPKFPTLTTNACDLRNLKCLHLEGWVIDPIFSSSEFPFPSLKVLTLVRCETENGKIRISGPSIEHIGFARTYIRRVELDVPNIRKFSFSGGERLPTLAFEAIPSSDWVSDLSIVYGQYGGIEFKTSWFLKLEKFLQQLSQSKISLSLEIGAAWMEVVYGFCDWDNRLGKPVVVEKLTVKLNGKYRNGDNSGKYRNGENSVLGCLFRSVEPKVITQSWEDLQRRHQWRLKRNGDKFVRLLCKAFFTPRLEEANVECFVETLAEWRPLSFKTILFDTSTSLDDKQLIRFHLKWRI